MPPYTVCRRSSTCPKAEGEFEDPDLPKSTPETFEGDSPYPKENPWAYNQPGYCRIFLARHSFVTRSFSCDETDINTAKYIKSKTESFGQGGGLSPDFGKTTHERSLPCYGDYYFGQGLSGPFRARNSPLYRYSYDSEAKRIRRWFPPEWQDGVNVKKWRYARRNHAKSTCFSCVPVGIDFNRRSAVNKESGSTNLLWIDVEADHKYYSQFLYSPGDFNLYLAEQLAIPNKNDRDLLIRLLPSDIAHYKCFKILCNRYPHQRPVGAPPYPPNKPPMRSCNCAEIEELLRGIHLRLGVDQYPVTVPESLVSKKDSTAELPDLTALIGWLARQIDALGGQFPIEIEIEDGDLLEEGNQRRKVELPNLAETLSELYALAYQSSVAGEIQINFLTRLTAELIATKNASLITQDYAKANASYLGYKGNPKRRKIRYAIDVEKSDKFTTLFTEVTKEIVGWEEDDPQTVAEYLQKLLYAAGIVKTVFLRKGNQAEGVVAGLRELFKGTSFDGGWQQFVDELKNPNSSYNAGAIPKPDIVDVSPDSVADRLDLKKKGNGSNNKP
ncbi:MAG: hypothetical protein HC816_21780 [Leptolyngbyaceae cyanobacterium RM1_1_2]|nr:hypothetical protein [Leptolyngbyaceae cyanobacterium RM1_1_2]